MDLHKLKNAPAAGIYEASGARHAEPPTVIKQMQDGTSTDDVRSDLGKKLYNINPNKNPQSLNSLAQSEPERTFMEKLSDAAGAAKEAYNRE
jgi:hypothetical protein